MIFASIIIRNNTKQEPLILINKGALEKQIESKDDFLLYVGSKDCKYCVEFEPKLRKLLDSENKSLYYLEITSNNKERNKMRTYLYSKDIKYIPIVAEFKDGKIVQLLDATNQMKEIKNLIKNI